MAVVHPYNEKTEGGILCYNNVMELSITRKQTKVDGSRKRWLLYGLIGVLFGLFDFYFQQIAQSDSSLVVRVIIIFGIWLVPLVPIALYEAKRSRSELKTAFACAFTWSIAIVAYYLYMVVELIAMAKDTRPELHFSNSHDPYYWSNLGQVLGNDMVGGILEWIPLALVGGGLLGLSIGFLYKTATKRKISKEKN